jgi:acyl-CoA synthetase (AMP-forming)/AMP-acid ligase II
MQLIQALTKRAHECPDRIAHRIADGDALDYASWWDRSRALAVELSAAVQPQARVGLAFNREESLDAAVALLAVWQTGGVPVMVPADRTVREDALDALGVAAIVRAPARLTVTPAAARRPAPQEGPEELHDAAIVLTSGTEGAPKAVAVPRRDLEREVEQWWADDVMFNLSPLSTGDGLGNLLAPLIDGRLVVTLTSVTGDAFWRAVAAHRPTYLKLVPSMIRLLDGRAVPAAAAGVARIALGSAAVGAREVDKLRTLFPGAKITVDYSSTESGRATLVCRVDDYESSGWIGELGRPRFGGEVRLMAPDGSVIEQPGVPGEIQLRPVDGRTRRVIAIMGGIPPRDPDGWVSMGDIGEYDDRNRLWFRCRSSEVVNVGGEKVSLPDVDAAIAALPGVAEAATAAVPHAVLGSAVAALVVAAPGTAPRQIRDAVAARFRGADRPCRMSFAEQIPRNATGKVSRADVARLVTGDPAPATPVTEESFMAVVRAALGEELSADDSVADSGASSLRLIVLCVDLEWTFGVLLEIFDLLAAASFRELIEVVGERQAALPATVNLADRIAARA